MKFPMALALYTVAIFLSAAMLFSVQPLFARMVLRPFGGALAVWNSCLFFFQREAQRQKIASEGSVFGVIELFLYPVLRSSSILRAAVRTASRRSARTGVTGRKTIRIDTRGPLAMEADFIQAQDSVGHPR